STNWGDLVFRDAPISNMDVSVSGGDPKVQYLVSASSFQQEGIVAPSAFDRKTGRLNLDILATDKLKLGTSMLYSRSTRNRVQNDDNINGALGGTHFFPPNLAPY